MGFTPINGLANRRLRPLGHLSASPLRPRRSKYPRRMRAGSTGRCRQCQTTLGMHLGILPAESVSWPSARSVARCRHEYPGPDFDRDAAASRGVRHHVAQFQSRSDRGHPRLSRGVRRRQHAGAQCRGHQGQSVRHHRPGDRRRHRAVGPYRRRAGRRPAVEHGSLDPDREARRQPLRPRHLRHEGLHRRRAEPRPGLPARPAQGADAFRLQLRRGGRLPRRAGAGREADGQRAAAARGDRRRADHDGRGQCAERRRRHRRHLHRRRGAFVDDRISASAPSTSPATSSTG